MAFAYNTCILIGRLTRDPELFELSKDKLKTIFTIAVDRGYKKEDGTTETDFIPVCIWGQQANIANKFLKKGSPVLVEGRLHIDHYEKEGENLKKTEIVANTFQLLEKLPKKEAAPV